MDAKKRGEMASSLSERLTMELRERITTGLLAPGSLVIEPALAEEFQVSKTPVRESLRQLTSEGLLQLLPKKGYLVRAISVEDIHEVLELRILLEPRAAHQVARFHSAQNRGGITRASGRTRAACRGRPHCLNACSASFSRRSLRGQPQYADHRHAYQMFRRDRERTFCAAFNAEVHVSIHGTRRASGHLGGHCRSRCARRRTSHAHPFAVDSPSHARWPGRSR